MKNTNGLQKSKMKYMGKRESKVLVCEQNIMCLVFKTSGQEYSPGAARFFNMSYKLRAKSFTELANECQNGIYKMYKKIPLVMKQKFGSTRMVVSKIDSIKKFLYFFK